MPLVFAAITPHPPIIVPDVGSQEDFEKCQKTVSAMQKLADNFRQAKPDTVIIVSPHSPIAPTAFAINTAATVDSSLADFGVSSPFYSLPTDTKLVDQITATTQADLGIAPIDTPALDHGVNVPLHYFLLDTKDLKIVSLSFSSMSLEKHISYGQLLDHIITKSEKRIAVIASGDLSHRLSPEAPAGFSPKGQEFDNHLVKLIKQGNLPKIAEIDENLAAEAGECGLRSFAILSGILEDHKYTPQVLSYEGPFGVGYLVADFNLE